MKKLLMKLARKFSRPLYFSKKNKVICNNTIWFKNNFKINGQNNFVSIVSSKIRKSSIHISGCDNKVIIHGNCNIIQANIWIEGNNNLVEIGENTIIGGSTDIICCESQKIIIGKDCLFSRDICLRTTDAHRICQNNVIINNPSDVIIGNHCWICQKASIMKGGLSNDSVLSFGAILTKMIPNSNVVVAGVPAKIVKENIEWKK